MDARGLFFGGLALAGIVLVGAQLDTVGTAPASPKPALAPVETSASNSPSRAASICNSLGGVTLRRGGDSHFYADALVNGARIRFLVDTGASSVVLTSEDARRAGIGAGDYSAKGIGAGGEIRLMRVTLTRLTLGPIAADGIPALVAEQGRLPVSLLGQSFLERVGSVSIRGDEMVLR